MKLEDIEKYKEELEAGIKKCMSNPVCERSTNAIDSMVLCWQHITDMENMIKKQFELTPEKAEEWLLNMQNEDGTPCTAHTTNKVPFIVISKEKYKLYL